MTRPGYGARAIVGDHDRVVVEARRDAGVAVGLGDRQVGLRGERIGIGGRVVGWVAVGDPGGRRGDGGRVGQVPVADGVTASQV